MKYNLLNLFIDKLYTMLKSEQLGFKLNKYGNGQDYTVTDLKNSDVIDFDKQFLLDNLSDYFFSLKRNQKDLLPILFHALISEHPQVVFNQLSSFPIFHKYRNGIDDSFPSLDCIFEKEDLALYLMHYNDKPLICQNYHCFNKLLNEIHQRFKSHINYISILLHNFKIHSKLIKKTNGNIIATRSWCINYLNNTEGFEDFITLKNDKPLFHKIEYHTLLKFIDIEIVQSRFVINNAKGIDDYKNFFKSLNFILNSPLIKKELCIERTEGQFVFDKKQYQLTIFSKKELNSDIIEENIVVLLNAVCDYYNKTNKQMSDFEGFVFKFFQFHSLQKKLVPLGKKSEKMQKI